jgi:flagellar assembly factor FliW
LIRVESERAGTVEVPETDVLEMSAPIPGFPAARKYCVIPTRTDEPTPFLWLQSVDEPKVAFIAVNPFDFFPDYDIELPRPDQEELDIREAEDVSLLALVSIPPGRPQDITANLVAPVVINTRASRARQVILYDSEYGTRHRLLPDPTSTEADSAAEKEAQAAPNAKAVGD